MLHIVTGGASSGKSSYAEELVCKFKGKRFYIATMYPYDEESKKRIKRHQLLRKDKAFKTVECFVDVGSIDIASDAVVLLECMSNLLANEMYLETGHLNDKYINELLANKWIIEPIIELSKKVSELVIVTNEIFSDGNEYMKETEEYIDILGYINRKLAEAADCVIEVVCGIPLKLK